MLKIFTILFIEIWDCLYLLWISMNEILIELIILLFIANIFGEIFVYISNLFS